MLIDDLNPTGSHGTTHQILAVAQSDGTPTLGTTTMAYDARGNRSYDDNTSTLSHDRRDYTYDGRGNVVNVHGQYYTGSAWHDYDVGSAFDAENRRSFKFFLDNSTGVETDWWLYYDALNRLTEIWYVPNAAQSPYTIFQLSWLDNRLVSYAQTDYPGVTVSKRYDDTDESGRPIEMWSWPSSGNASRVWAINPSAWGFDKNLLGPTLFQPVLLAGQYSDSESIALENDGTTPHRPGVVLNGGRTYDPFVGAYLQVDALTGHGSSYVYAASDPIGNDDRNGNVNSNPMEVSTFARSFSWSWSWPWELGSGALEGVEGLGHYGIICGSCGTPGCATAPIGSDEETIARQSVAWLGGGFGGLSNLGGWYTSCSSCVQTCETSFDVDETFCWLDRKLYDCVEEAERNLQRCISNCDCPLARELPVVVSASMSRARL